MSDQRTRIPTARLMSKPLTTKGDRDNDSREQGTEPVTHAEVAAAKKVFFGATVRYADGAGTERVVSIVGVDEVDLDRNHISWMSPLARALMKSAAGDTVVLQAPGGTEHLTVLDVRYERIPVK